VRLTGRPSAVNRASQCGFRPPGAGNGARGEPTSRERRDGQLWLTKPELEPKPSPGEPRAMRRRKQGEEATDSAGSPEEGRIEANAKQPRRHWRPAEQPAKGSRMSRFEPVATAKKIFFSVPARTEGGRVEERAGTEKKLSFKSHRRKTGECTADAG